MRSAFAVFAAIAIVFGSLSKIPPVRAATETEIVPQIGHADAVHSIAFSPNGRLLVTSDSGHVVKLWDAKSGLLLRTLTVFGVRSAIFSPDNRFIVSGQTDGTITFWDPTTGKPQRHLKDARYVRGLAFSSDGRTLAAMTLGSVQIWDVEKGTRRLTLKPRHDLGAMALSADGRNVITGGEEHSGKWDHGDQASFEARQDMLDSIDDAGRTDSSDDDRASLFTGLQIAKDGEQIKGAALTLWDATTGKLLKTVNIGRAKQKVQQFEVRFLALAAGGHEIICETEEIGESWRDHELRLRVLDAASGRETRVLASDNTTMTVDMSADQRAVAVGGLKSVRLLNPANGSEVQRLGVKSAVGLFAISPDNLTLAGTAVSGPRIWSFSASDDVGSAQQLDPLEKVAVTRDGQTIVSFSTGQLWLWDAKSGRLLHSFKIGETETKGSFSADGARLAAVTTVKHSAGEDAYRIRIFDGATGLEIRMLDFESQNSPTAMSLSPDGKAVVLLASSKDRQDRLQVWDADTGKKLHNVARCAECDELIAFSPDGKSFITGDNGYNSSGGNYYAKYRLTLWETKSGDMLKTVDHVDALFVRGSAFSPDGREFVMSEGKSIELRDATTLQLLQATPKKSVADTIRAIAFSPDGETMATSGDDQLVGFWDPKSLNLLKASAGHTGAVGSLAISPDGLTIISAGRESTLRRWGRDGSLSATSIATKDGEWLTITPEGFFDASRNGGRMLAVVRGLETFGIDQLYQSLYRPDLVREKLAGDPRGLVREAAANLDLGKVLASGAAPDVRVTVPGRAIGSVTVDGTSATAEAEITDRGGGIGRVEWRVNGVTIGVDNFAAGGPSPLRLTRSLALEPGDNALEVMAYNGANLVASVAARLSIVARAAPPAAAPQAAPAASPVAMAKPRLFVLAAGVNDYADGRFKLEKAVWDAQEVARGFREASANLYQSVEVKLMTDADVTRDKLDAAFGEIAARAAASDVFVLYIAGHGKTVDGRYYFVPQDFIIEGELSERAIDAAVKAKAVSQEQWQRWFAQVPARKSVMLFDTCESGTLADDETQQLEKGAASDRLAQATGRSILAASSGSQEALEGYRGHGLFTFEVLDAINESDGDHNGTVELNELAAYVYAQVAEVSQKVFKQRQVPQMKLTANYALTTRMRIIRDEAAPVAEARPTYQVTQTAQLQVQPGSGETVVRSLSAKTGVTVLESRNGWSLVANGGKPIGYVATRDLAPVR